MNSHQEEVTTARDYSHITISTRKLGQGVAGNVYFAEYTITGSRAQDQDILDLTNSTNSTVNLAIKQLNSSTADAEQIAINERLFALHKNNLKQNKESPFVPAIFDSNSVMPRFISPFVTYNGTDSNDVEGYLSSMAETRADNIPVEETGAALVHFAFAIKEGQDALHDIGIWHNDVATRNLLMTGKKDGVYTAKLIDYDRAKVFDSSYQYTRSKGTGPVRYMDPDSLHGLVTLNSQLYMRRAAILELAANMLGEWQGTLLGPHVDSSLEEALAFVLNNSIPDIFTQYVKNLNSVIDKKSADPRAQGVKAFLDSFQNYLTSIPQRKEGETEEQFFWRAQQEEDKLFLQATTNSFNRGLISPSYYEQKKAELETRISPEDVQARRERLIPILEENARIKVRSAAQVQTSAQEAPESRFYMETTNETQQHSEVLKKDSRNYMATGQYPKESSSINAQKDPGSLFATTIDQLRSDYQKSHGILGWNKKALDALVEELGRKHGAALRGKDPEASAKAIISAVLKQFCNAYLKEHFKVKVTRGKLQLLVDHVNSARSDHALLRSVLIQLKELGNPELANTEILSQQKKSLFNVGKFFKDHHKKEAPEAPQSTKKTSLKH